MYFILDALKKSELERQRQSIPGLMESATTQKSRRLPPWAIALVALLGINLVVLLYVLTRTGSSGADSHPARAPHPASAAPTVAQQPGASETGRQKRAGDPRCDVLLAQQEYLHQDREQNK